VELPAGWVRAFLGLAISAVLTEGPLHGYAIAQRLTDLGLGPVRGGVLYPVLNRLEADGAVSSQWQAGEGGPGRKVYALTADGRERLNDERATWAGFTRVLDAVLAHTTGEDE
jgi:PadR family transcriptional regulator PadR